MRILLSATFLSNVPFALGMAHLLGETLAAYVLSVLLGIALGLGIRGRIALAFDDRPISAARRWLLEKPYWVHWCAGLGSIPVAVITAPLLLLDGWSLGRWGALSYGLPFVTALYAVLVRPHMLRVREIEVEIGDLPAAFDGYRVAQLSDLHIGALTPPERAPPCRHRPGPGPGSAPVSGPAPRRHPGRWPRRQCRCRHPLRPWPSRAGTGRPGTA